MPKTNAKDRPTSDLLSLIIASALTFLMLGPTLSASTPQPGIAPSRQSISERPAPAIEAARPDAQRTLAALHVEFEMRPGDSGLLLVGGDDSETFALYVQSGRAVWVYQSIFEERAVSIESDDLAAGVVNIRFEFAPEQGAAIGRYRMGAMFVNGICAGRMPPDYSATPDPERSSQPGSDDAQIERVAPESSFTGRITRVDASLNGAP